MKKVKIITFLILLIIVSGVSVSAQTANEIITKYIQAIGGKELISKINSLYIEATMQVMGTEGAVKTTILNGKGYRNDVDYIGNEMVQCYNEKEGWTINPMMGSGDAESMPEVEYNSAKTQIFIEAPLIFYAEKGYKAELLGNEAVGSINAYKLKLTAPDNTSAIYYFDSATGYKIKSIMPGKMMGRTIENTITYSDFRQTDGYTIAFKTVTSMGGQYETTNTVNKIVLNIQVDAAIFVKPE